MLWLRCVPSPPPPPCPPYTSNYVCSPESRILTSQTSHGSGMPLGATTQLLTLNLQPSPHCSVPSGLQELSRSDSVQTLRCQHPWLYGLPHWAACPEVPPPWLTAAQICAGNTLSSNLLFKRAHSQDIPNKAMAALSRHLLQIK